MDGFLPSRSSTTRKANADETNLEPNRKKPKFTDFSVGDQIETFLTLRCQRTQKGYCPWACESSKWSLHDKNRFSTIIFEIGLGKEREDTNKFEVPDLEKGDERAKITHPVISSKQPKKLEEQVAIVPQPFSHKSKAKINTDQVYLHRIYRSPFTQRDDGALYRFFCNTSLIQNRRLVSLLENHLNVHLIERDIIGFTVWDLLLETPASLQENKFN